MSEEKKTSPIKKEDVTPTPVETQKVNSEKEDQKNESKVESKKPEKKPEKKEVASAKGVSLKISPKQSFAVCKVIRGKSPEQAIKRLEDVVLMKRAIPMAGREVAHQKGKGLSGAKYPKNACEDIIRVVKQVGANAVVAGIENPIITIAKADRASAPYRKGGRRAKRTHIYIEVRDKAIIKSKEAKK